MPACLQVNTSPHLVLLDVGMVAELDPGDQQNLVGFFKARVYTTHLVCGSLWHLEGSSARPGPAKCMQPQALLGASLSL